MGRFSEKDSQRHGSDSFTSDACPRRQVRPSFQTEVYLSQNTREVGLGLGLPGAQQRNPSHPGLEGLNNTSREFKK